ncbi:MAG: ComF family protein [Clostridia bacterium]|nr:ComF family protein [Clostridia bacterium]
MKKAFEYLKRALAPRLCILCARPVSYLRDMPICDYCKMHWIDQLDLLCPVCGYESEYCTCTAKHLFGKIDFVAFCVFYKSGYGNPANNIVYKLKRDYNGQVIDFCAEQMKRKTVKEFAKQNLSYKDYTVTFPPRRSDGYYEFGYDHAQLLAENYAKKLGLPVQKCFKNVGKAEQKTLSKNERIQNALKSFVPLNDIDVKDKKFILIDDVLTTGATLNACATLLLRMGAKSVVSVCFAKDI